MKVSVIILVVVLLAVSIEAGKNCKKQAKKAKKAGKPQPQCYGKQFKAMQCDDKKCWCVKVKGGKHTFKGFLMPKGTDWNCKSK